MLPTFGSFYLHGNLTRQETEAREVQSLAKGHRSCGWTEGPEPRQCSGREEATTPSQGAPASGFDPSVCQPFPSVSHLASKTKVFSRTLVG